jgi:DNA-binding transcriptional MerR regulator/DNA-directed RNA polymerase subunit RPC12/RpoP
MLYGKGKEVKSMSKYTTGEMAKLCNVSVRTVQFYDTKRLLLPSDLTEGGRRLYNDDDLTKLRLICALKAIGLSLDSIKEILESESSVKVLSLLLDEQMHLLADEIKERQSQLEAIKVIKESIRDMATIPVNAIIDIEHIMESKKGLKKVHGTMLGVGLAMAPFQIGSIVLWIVKGLWIPFVIVYGVAIPICILLVRMYYKNTAYICAECNATFRPKLKEFLFSAHTPKTRKLTCEKCGHVGYCIETFALSPKLNV